MDKRTEKIAALKSRLVASNPQHARIFLVIGVMAALTAIVWSDFSMATTGLVMWASFVSIAIMQSQQEAFIGPILDVLIDMDEETKG